MKASPDLELVPSASNNVMYSSFNTAKPPFKDLNLRKAVTHAINREALAKIITGGYGGTVAGVEIAGKLGDRTGVEAARVRSVAGQESLRGFGFFRNADDDDHSA